MNTPLQWYASKEYQEWLLDIKKRIGAARIRVAFVANKELINFYFELGELISRKQEASKWGDKVIAQLSLDLKKEYPDIKGLSASNLKYCKRFYLFYSMQNIIGQQVVDQIPWGHNIIIFTKTKNHEEALFYIQQTVEQGWSRDVLGLQIKSNLFQRTGASVTNFKKTLPDVQSDLAQETLKDPYTFDFLTMTAPYNEMDIEKQLVYHITKFLLELGKGFAFIGRQYHLLVGETDYYIDLLFYHVILKCYVVVELKNKKFIPEYAGKLNFYLSAVDSYLKKTDDNPSIGLILCRDKTNIEVEFALRDMKKPIGVSEYILTEELPNDLVGTMPTVEEIEADFERLENEL